MEVRPKCRGFDCRNLCLGHPSCRDCCKTVCESICRAEPFGVVLSTVAAQSVARRLQIFGLSNVILADL